MESNSLKDIYDKLIGKPLTLKKPIENEKNNSIFDSEINANQIGINPEICIILSHANTPDKKQILHECLESIKIEKILSSNYPVDVDTQLLSNWTLYDSSNDLLLESEYKEYNVTYYHWKLNSRGEVITKNQAYEHGYAVYKLIRNGLLFAKSIGKSIIHVVNYDYLIPHELLYANTISLNDFDVVLYSDASGMYENRYSTGLFSGKIDSLLKFFQHYKSKRDYYLDYEIDKISSIWIEGKIHKFYNTRNFNINEKSIDSLKKQSELQSDLKIDRVTVITSTFD